MPTAAPKPCRHPGCGALVRDGSGYCAKHATDKQQGKWGDDRRGTRQERGYDAEWEARRKRTLREDSGLCRPHRKVGKFRPAKAVDHIVAKAIARAAGWTEEQIEADENLQSICTDCHKVKTAFEAKYMRQTGGRVESLPPSWPGPDA